MKKILASLGAVVCMSAAGSATAAPDIDCYKEAFDFGRVLGQSYCEGLKQAYANDTVIVPMRRYSLRTSNQCGFTYTLICKNAMSQAVGQDRFCRSLYYRNFRGPTLKDAGFNNARDMYATIQRGCNQ